MGRTPTHPRRKPGNNAITCGSRLWRVILSHFLVYCDVYAIYIAQFYLVFESALISVNLRFRHDFGAAPQGTQDRRRIRIVQNRTKKRSIYAQKVVDIRDARNTDILELDSQDKYADRVRLRKCLAHIKLYIWQLCAFEQIGICVCPTNNQSKSHLKMAFIAFVFRVSISVPALTSGLYFAFSIVT